jgi:hypothetical protein
MNSESSAFPMHLSHCATVPNHFCPSVTKTTEWRNPFGMMSILLSFPVDFPKFFTRVPATQGHSAVLPVYPSEIFRARVRFLDRLLSLSRRDLHHILTMFVYFNPIQFDTIHPLRSSPSLRHPPNTSPSISYPKSFDPHSPVHFTKRLQYNGDRRSSPACWKNCNSFWPELHYPHLRLIRRNPGSHSRGQTLPSPRTLRNCTSG